MVNGIIQVPSIFLEVLKLFSGSATHNFINKRPSRSSLEYNKV